MTRKQMRDLLRIRLMLAGGSPAGDLTASTLNTQLNHSAQHVALYLAQHATIAYGRNTYSISGQSSNVVTLTNVTDFHSPLVMKGGSGFHGGRQISEQELEQKKKESEQPYDEDGKYYFCIYYDPANTTSPYSIEFLATPGDTSNGLSFTFVYNKLVPAIADGTSGDAESYAVVPVQYHEWVVQHALMMLLGHSHAEAAAFSATYFGQLSRTNTMDTRLVADSLQLTTDRG